MRKTPAGIAEEFSVATQNIERVQRLGITAPTAQLLDNLTLAIRALERAKQKIRVEKKSRLAADMDPTDLKGIPVLNEDGKAEWIKPRGSR